VTPCVRLLHHKVLTLQKSFHFSDPYPEQPSACIKSTKRLLFISSNTDFETQSVNLVKAHAKYCVGSSPIALGLEAILLAQVVDDGPIVVAQAGLKCVIYRSVTKHRSDQSHQLSHV
jgi:hypothetical protein